ncbi:hypothetical protein [Natrinema salsiterrestre]|uniref:Uncharacterized protein n=1 Tax=Natrinema salsiterrestre TaxID=2950540 RepID=A0A9Q4L086_9EURY|nr:hypothetical protein [Natrinema salsiterrestre]MDF9745177.1 hypothetical protein [Natrinema salsiterrestre]
MIDIPDTLAHLEQPEYTGENRCLPCTAVNVVLGLALAVGLGVAVSVPVGALAFAAALLLIRVRGYLVPGTPTLTRRYLPERALELFDKSPRTGPTIETVSPDELAAVLTAADVATARGESIRLSAGFETRWDERLSSGGAAEPGSDELQSMLGAEEVDRLDDVAFVLDGIRRIRWESTAALAADTAAAPELRSRIDGWDDLGVDERRDLLTGLRLLRERCPGCGSEVRTTAERLEHCCRRPRIGISSVCAGCNEPVVELVASESSADPWLELAGVSDGP